VPGGTVELDPDVPVFGFRPGSILDPPAGASIGTAPPLAPAPAGGRVIVPPLAVGQPGSPGEQGKGTVAGAA
jgi:hypothetical protein